MPAHFCKQITPSEPGGACPSRWRRRWNVAPTVDWQGGTFREKQDELEDGQSEGWKENWKKEEDRIRNGRPHDVEGIDRKQVWVKRGEDGEKCGSPFFVECPLGVALSSQSGGLIRVKVWILSPWEASKRLIKIEVELKLDAQEDRGHNNGLGEGGWALPSPFLCSLYPLSVPFTLPKVSLPLLL